MHSRLDTLRDAFDEGTKSSESGNIKKLNAVKKKNKNKKSTKKTYCKKMFLKLLKRSI